jgi:heterodisulfide reductase subunit B
MKFAYYPGCTLRTTARQFDMSVRAISPSLGIELEELASWTCCGAVVPLVTDNVMNLIAPIRNLAQAMRCGHDVITLCSFCYNVLKRANVAVKSDPEKLQKINNFIEEVEYDGGVRVLHLLEVLRDEIGFGKVRQLSQQSLDGLKVAPYYGCMLLRPAKIGMDDPEEPHILEDLLQSVGCEVVDWPLKTECCGSYLTISSPATALACSHRVVTSAVRAGADMIVTSCPLCHFNLGQRQSEMARRYARFEQIPVTYFTRPLEVALGLEITDREGRDFVRILKNKGIL